MADFTALKTAIQTYIKQNGNEEITGNILQGILLSIVTTLGDSAINDLITALGNEVNARQQADGTLQQNITDEATARGNADTALSNRLGSTITAENTAADQIAALQGLIDGITDNIENGYVYAGIATPSSTPTTGKVFYLALTAGTYTNFGSTVVSQGINILKYNGSTWSLDAFIGFDDTPTPNSPKLVKSGGAFDSVMTNGSAFNISAHFASGGTLATYADLSAALTALNTLSASYKRGGMSIKFVQSSDNKYVQYRLMSDSFNTTVANWQGVDNEPTDGSDNLVKSSGAQKIWQDVYANSSEMNWAKFRVDNKQIESDGSITRYNGRGYIEIPIVSGCTEIYPIGFANSDGIALYFAWFNNDTFIELNSSGVVLSSATKVCIGYNMTQTDSKMIVRQFDSSSNAELAKNIGISLKNKYISFENDKYNYKNIELATKHLVELYLIGIDTTKTYKISQLFKSQTGNDKFIRLQIKDSNTTVINYTGSANSFPKGIIQLSQYESSGISGYAVLNFDIDDPVGADYNVPCILNNEAVSDYEQSPLIKAYLEKTNNININTLNKIATGQAVNDALKSNNIYIVGNTGWDKIKELYLTGLNSEKTYTFTQYRMLSTGYLRVQVKDNDGTTVISSSITDNDGVIQLPQSGTSGISGYIIPNLKPTDTTDIKFVVNNSVVGNIDNSPTIKDYVNRKLPASAFLTSAIKNKRNEVIFTEDTDTYDLVSVSTYQELLSALGSISSNKRIRLNADINIENVISIGSSLGYKLIIDGAGHKLTNKGSNILPTAYKGMFATTTFSDTISPYMKFYGDDDAVMGLSESDFYTADGQIEDMTGGIFRFKLPASIEEIEINEGNDVYINLSSHFHSYVEKVVKTEGGYLYFSSTSESLSDLNGDYTFRNSHLYTTFFLINYELKENSCLIKNSTLYFPARFTHINICNYTRYFNLENIQETVTLQDIVFVGAQVHCVSIDSGDEVRVSHCTFTDMSASAISSIGNTNLMVTNCVFKNIGRSAIDNVGNISKLYATNNIIEECSERRDNYPAIRAKGAYYIAYNKIKNYGQIGIFVGNNSITDEDGNRITNSKGIVEYNSIRQTPEYTEKAEYHNMMDNGAIYVATNNIECIIRNNIIVNHRGRLENHGIYGDDAAYNLYIFDNIINSVSGNSIFCWNAASSDRYIMSGYTKNTNRNAMQNVVDKTITMSGENNTCNIGINLILGKQFKLVDTQNRLVYKEDQISDKNGYINDGVINTIFTSVGNWKLGF